jgi:hypothetical protein
MSKDSDAVGSQRQQEQIIGSTDRVITGDKVDQEARDIGKDASSRIKSHEVLCAERWNQARDAMQDLSKTIDELRKQINSYVPPLPGAAIAGLMGMCGWLAARAFPMH